MQRSIKEIEQEDVASIVNYWHQPDHDFLISMGVDLSKIPPRQDLYNMLIAQMELPYQEKQSYCIIWLLNGEAVGHSNVNKIVFGREAYMHLHLWQNASRQKGMGTSFVKMTIPYFFRNLQLKDLYCEPYALNPAPNKTLQRVGFTKLKTYTTIPGYLNYEQEVNLWHLSQEQSQTL